MIHWIGRRKLGIVFIAFGFVAVFLAFPIRPIGNVLGFVGIFVALGGFLLSTIGGILATMEAADARNRVGQKLAIAILGPVIPAAMIILYLQHVAGFNFPLSQISYTLAGVGMVGGVRTLSQAIFQSA